MVPNEGGSGVGTRDDVSTASSDSGDAVPTSSITSSTTSIATQYNGFPFAGGFPTDRPTGFPSWGGYGPGVGPIQPASSATGLSSTALSQSNGSQDSTKLTGNHLITAIVVPIV